MVGDDESKFPGRSDWSPLKQVKGSEDRGHPRHRAQQVQRPKDLLVCGLLWLAWAEWKAAEEGWRAVWKGWS